MDTGVSGWAHGPTFEDDGIRFRVWGPGRSRIDLLIDGRPKRAMTQVEDGFFETFIGGLGAGALYRFSADDGAPFPDPASRYQPLDVHGPSETIDPSAYPWKLEWAGRSWNELVLYELHVGAFTREGTFAAAARKLDHLVELGVTAVEIMPIGDFSGRWNWGYDGVYPYAPDSSYGRPEGFKAFVDAAHRRGLCVLLDVVYNHLGPEGNYLRSLTPAFFTSRHKTPWGDALNFDGSNSGPVREFFMQNAEYWIEEFRLDGLRLDAVHEIKDDSRPDLLEEVATRLRTRFSRPIHLILENESNDPTRLTRRDGRAQLYTAQLNDDVHHVLHVAATGETGGYYSAYGDTALLARAIAEGFAYQGQMMPYRERPRGGPSGELPPGAFVSFVQNHDQIGNRAFGERLAALVSPEVLRALASVYLLCPQTPMLFMGEEWGATSPFPFFCDFDGDLAEAVREGRRREFSRFPEFSDPRRVAEIPDPLARATFESAKLDWERADSDHLAFYRALLRTRRERITPILPDIDRAGESAVVSEHAVRVIWSFARRRLVLDANLSPERVEFPHTGANVFWRCGDAEDALGPWSVRWGVESP